MCCFSGNVKEVAETNIFARASKEGRQFLVYSMRVDAPAELAMILPIPAPKSAKEDAVRFINLEKYPEFFTELGKGFPPSRDVQSAAQSPSKSDSLKVVEVGSFVASFVPSVKDFSRVDPRFRLPTEVWDKLPMYKDYGFAVFQLKKGEQKVHPMAFEFPRADPKRLFFPTVHIHDGTVKAKAHFDHALFCQSSGEEELVKWEESSRPVGLYMKNFKASQGLLDADAHCYRQIMVGELKNADTWA